MSAIRTMGSRLKSLTRSRNGRFQVVCPDFGRLGSNAALRLCTLPHFNAYELQRFTSRVALLADVSLSRRSGGFILQNTHTF